MKLAAKQILAGAAITSAMAFATPAWSIPISFDMESLSIGGHASGLSLTNGGLTLSITTEGNPNGFIVVTNSNVGLLGNRSVIGSNTNPTAVGQFTPMRFSFSSLVDSVTFLVGDSGGDNDSPLVIQAYSPTDILLGTITDSYPLNYAGGRTETANFAGASYYILSSGSDIRNPNSLFWEVSAVTLRTDSNGGNRLSVPEPATLGLLGITFGAAAWSRRRKKA